MLLTCGSLLFGGCASIKNIFKKEEKPAEPDPIIQPQPKPVPRYDGSLWIDNLDSDLYADRKAYRLGDLITVNIIENSKAQKVANTQASKNSTIKAGIDNLFGLEKAFPGSNFSLPTAISTSYGSANTGGGQTSSSGELVATISVRVVEVLPNGNLKIKGAQEITINKETQLVHLAGTIRPEDIKTNNTIISTSIAEAKIVYSTKGSVGDKQRQGWFIWVLDWIWPF